MWTQINRYLPEFETAVLSGFDASGRPSSLRTRPVVEAGVGLHLPLPGYVDFSEGPACLLCHRHDERLWNLKSFVLRGRLEQNEPGWFFRPEQFIPGVGIGGLISYVRFLRDGRRTTRRYLQKRGLARPVVPWEEWQAVFEETITLETGRVDNSNGSGYDE